MTRAALALILAGCCHEPVLPPASLACQLRAPPPWYEVEPSPLPDCLVVVGQPIPLGPCCPADTVCLSLDGGRALIVDHNLHTAWEAEAFARCGVRP